MCELTHRHLNPDFFLKTLCVFLYIAFVNTLNSKEINPPLPKGYSLDGDYRQMYEKGMDFFNRNKPDSAMVCFTIVAGSALESKTHADSILASKAYNMLGIVDFYARNYLGAYSNYKKAISAGGDKNVYWIYNNMAIVLNMFKAYDDSEELLKKTYYLAKADTASKAVMHLYHAYSNLLNQSFVNDRLNNIETEIKDFKQLPLLQEGPSRFLSEVSQGVQEYLYGRFPKAVACFKRADDFSNQIWIPIRGNLDCCIYLAKTFQAMNQPDSALLYLTKAENIAGGEDVGDHLVDILGLISGCYESMGNKAMADRYRMRYYALKDSLSSITDFSEMKNLDLHYEVGNYENLIVKANLERDQNRRYLLIISVTLIVFAILFVAMIIQNKRLAATNKSLFEKNVEILKASDAEKSHFMESLSPDKHIASSLTHSLSDNGMTASQDIEPGGKDIGSNDVSATIMAIDISEQMRIKKGIEGFFYNSLEWLSTDFGLDDLAKAVGSNKQYVSQVMNDVMNTNFYSLLNEHRINEARRRLLDTEKYGGMTIEAIAESIGYKSRSNFSKNFKKYTGLNPKEYVIIARSQS